MTYFGYFYFSCIHFELEMHSQHLDPLFIPNQIKKPHPLRAEEPLNNKNQGSIILWSNASANEIPRTQ